MVFSLSERPNWIQRCLVRRRYRKPVLFASERMRSWSWWGVSLGQCLGLLGNVKIPEEGEDDLSRKVPGNHTLIKVSGISISMCYRTPTW